MCALWAKIKKKVQFREAKAKSTFFCNFFEPSGPGEMVCGAKKKFPKTFDFSF